MSTHPERNDEDLKALSAALHERFDPVVDEAVPERLSRAARPPLRRLAMAAGWIATGLAVGVLAGWQIHGARMPVGAQQEPAAIARRAAIAHATYSPEVRHPVEVGADQEAHLVAWLSKRLGASVRAPHLEDVGYTLIGGRLLPPTDGNGRPVAQFMYQCKQGTRVTLYVRTDVRGNEETAFRYSSEGKVRVFYWIDRSYGYAISSADVGKDTLQTVANAVYKQLNP